jgi:type IV pilus assembly protein PilC
VLLIAMSNHIVKAWWMLPLIPLSFWLFIKLLRKFKHGKAGWDQFMLKVPIVGALIEKNAMARTTRTLGTLVASGVPILEALTITRETAGNAMFERLYGKVTDAIREGETISAPLKNFSAPGFHPVAAFWWMFMCAIPGMLVLFLPGVQRYGLMLLAGGGALGFLFYLTKIKSRIVDDLVVNMVDVGEETGELDTMLYKVADVYDEEVRVMTDGLMALLEPIMIVFLGVAVGFIVISLFLPLVELIQGLSG